MTEATAVSSIPLVIVTDGEFQDGSLQTDPILQSGTYIDAELNNDVLSNEGKGANLTPALAGTTLEMQKTALAAEMLMPVHQVNVEKPSLLSGEWKFETQICHVDKAMVFLKEPLYLSGGRSKPSETPQSKKHKSGSKTKKVTPFHFDSANPPESVSWVLTDSNEDTWKPFVDGNMVPETQKCEWDDVFSRVSKLKREEKPTGK